MIASKKQNIKRIIYTSITLLIICFIFIQSILPGDISGAESSRVLAFLNSITGFLGLGNVFSHSFVRTCAHFTEFAFLGLFSFLTYSTYSLKRISSVFTTILTYPLVAVIDESIQLFSQGRAFQFSDILIDIAGGTTGFLLGVIFILISTGIKNRRREQNERNSSK